MHVPLFMDRRQNGFGPYSSSFASRSKDMSVGAETEAIHFATQTIRKWGAFLSRAERRLDFCLISNSQFSLGGIPRLLTPFYLSVREREVDHIMD